MSLNVLQRGKRYFFKPYVKGYPSGKFEQASKITRAEVFISPSTSTIFLCKLMLCLQAAKLVITICSL